MPGQTGPNPLKNYNFERGISLQAKIDGIRARIWKINGEIKIYSRENNIHPWLDTYIKPEVNIILVYLPSGVGLDCELYNPKYLFTTLTSLVKTYKTKHPKNDEIYCYIFDLILLNTPFDNRIEMLRNAYTRVTSENTFKRVVVVDHTVIYKESQIKLYHDEFVKLGYEGMMIRKLIGIKFMKSKEKQFESEKVLSDYENMLISQRIKGKKLKDVIKLKMKELFLLSREEIEETWYKPDRNNNLLKVKSFIDEEAIVIDIISAEGRESGLAMIEVQDIRGNKFVVRPRGSFEDRKMWLINKNQYINKKYTIRYFELSEYGVPRFPVGIAFRDYE